MSHWVGLQLAKRKKGIKMENNKSTINDLTTIKVEQKYKVKFFDKRTALWIDLNSEPLSKEKAEALFNRHTHHGAIYVEPKEDLYFVMKEIQ